MAITIRDILTLKSMKQFVPVAGQSGISKYVEMIDMLEIGWERDKTYSLKLFDMHSFVISSLMFAKNDSDKLYETIRCLIECGVVGLAYKPVFYNDLPKEVCRLADENDFPIFRIDDNTTYREIIYEITDAIRLNKNTLIKETYLSRMMSENLAEEDVSDLVTRISPYFLKNAKVITVLDPTNKNPFSIDCVIRRFQKYEQFKDGVVLCRFAPGLALIVTMDDLEVRKFDVIINNVLSVCGIKRDSVWLAQSKIHPTYTELDQCIKEAYFALIAGQVLDKQDIRYIDIGTLSFLIPMINSSYIQANMQDYLSPIIGDERYLRTAIEFIRSEGDCEIAAKKLNYHKNTVRYRISKIQSNLSPELSYEAFYEKLSIAIKTYLIKQISFSYFSKARA